MRSFITFSYDTEQDADIIDWLGKQKNKSAAMRQAVRAFINQEQQKITLADIYREIQSLKKNGLVVEQPRPPEDEPTEAALNLEKLLRGEI